jgi:hypothetical protein
MGADTKTDWPTAVGRNISLRLRPFAIKLYTEGQWPKGIHEKLKELSAWGYKRATLFLGDINTKTWQY